jgi:ATP-dependent Clp protease ATP-binding subunit ClpC
MSYGIKKFRLKTVDYTLLIFKIPVEEINDKLTYFTREKGLIAKSLFEDFLIANCVSNITPFLQHLQQKGTTLEQLNDIRAEIVEKILEINPKLSPDSLVINSNHVVKMKEGSLDDDERLLSQNEFWKKDFYRDTAKVPVESVPQSGGPKKIDMSKIQNVQDLNYIKVQKFWRRLNQYITIKQFEPGSELVILGNRSFNTRTSFEQYVVIICVDEIEDLFDRLDKMGMPQRVPTPNIIRELYELCRKSNPFLDFDIYKDTMGIEDDTAVDASIDPFEDIEGLPHTSADSLSAALKKKSKLFKDVNKETLLNLDKNINKKVVGQQEAVNDLVDAIQRASVGLRDPEQPIGSFIFTGYTGVGKTYTAKILAEELIGSRHGIVMIDCSEYAADHEYAKLIGAPSGYIGHEQGGYLTNAIKKNPFSVVLFDEIEKASEKVHQLMLQIMEESRLTDGKGQQVSFKDAVIVMTSNLGVKETQQIGKTIGFGDVAKLTKEKRVAAVMQALKKKFKPEFLNRVTCMVNFEPLTKKDYIKIIKLELDKLKKYLKLNRTDYSRLDITFDKSLYSHIYKVGIDEKYGARPLKRAIEREISTPLARKLLKEDIDCSNTKVVVSSKKGKIVINVSIIKEIDDPPFYMEAGKDD